MFYVKNPVLVKVISYYDNDLHKYNLTKTSISSFIVQKSSVCVIHFKAKKYVLIIDRIINQIFIRIIYIAVLQKI